MCGKFQPATGRFDPRRADTTTPVVRTVRVRPVTVLRNRMTWVRERAVGRAEISVQLGSRCQNWSAVTRPANASETVRVREGWSTSMARPWLRPKTVSATDQRCRVPRTMARVSVAGVALAVAPTGTATLAAPARR